MGIQTVLHLSDFHLGYQISLQQTRALEALLEDIVQLKERVV